MSQVSSHLMAHKKNPIQNPHVLKSSYLLSYLIGYRLGLGDVYQIGIVMNDDFREVGLGACSKHECACIKAQNTNNMF